MNKDKVDQDLQQRRKTIRSIGITGGLAATSAATPTKWLKPVVENVLLPAHARTSCVDPLWSLSLSLRGIDRNSDSEDYFNLDFVVQTPNGGVLQPPAGSQTTTLQYAKDLGEAVFDAGSTLRDINTDRVRQRSDSGAQCSYPEGTYRIAIQGGTSIMATVYDGQTAEVRLEVE